MRIITYTDGGSRGNPGHAASGVYITDGQNKELIRFGTYLGIQTNNFAEYTAIIEALTWILQHRKSLETIDAIECRMDSLLACKQLRGEYKVKHPGIKPLFAQVKLLQQALSLPFSFVHIPRELNKMADSQVNITLDKMLPPSL